MNSFQEKDGWQNQWARLSIISLQYYYNEDYKFGLDKKEGVQTERNCESSNTYDMLIVKGNY